MPINLRCPTCNAGLTVPESAAGKKGKCPSCQTKIDIPAAQPDLFDVAEDPTEYEVPAHDGASWMQPPPQVAAAQAAPPPLQSPVMPAAPAMDGMGVVRVDDYKRSPRSEPARVIVIDFDMPFGRLVMFLVKLAIAAIPATLILWFISIGVLLFVYVMLRLIFGAL
jgi:hypothetical protein